MSRLIPFTCSLFVKLSWQAAVVRQQMFPDTQKADFPSHRSAEKRHTQFSGESEHRGSDGDHRRRHWTPLILMAVVVQSWCHYSIEGTSKALIPPHPNEVAHSCERNTHSQVHIYIYSCKIHSINLQIQRPILVPFSKEERTNEE